MSQDECWGWSGCEEALHGACRDGDAVRLAQLLRSARYDPLAEDRLYGWAPLHWAAYFGKLDCLSTLVQAGASVTTVTSRYAQTPAHIAAFGGHQHCLLWLLRVGANVNQQDYLGETPLHKAARSGSEECVHLLVACGAQVEVPNHSGITPLELAISQGFSRPAAFLANELARRRGDAGGGGVGGAAVAAAAAAAAAASVSNGDGGGRSRKRSHGDANANGDEKKARCQDDDVEEEEELVENAWPYILHGPERAWCADAERHGTGFCPAERGLPQADPSNGVGGGSGGGGGGVGGGETGAANPGTDSCSHSPSNVMDFSNGGAAECGMECGRAGEEGEREGERSPPPVLFGQLHQNGSPSSMVEQRPLWPKRLGWLDNGERDNDDFYAFGHYHGFGDSAEDFEDVCRSSHDRAVAAAAASRNGLAPSQVHDQNSRM